MSKSGRKTRRRVINDKLRPDWNNVCENCGSKPVVPLSGLCGPCHFGTAEASGGGWWDEGADELSDIEW